MKSTKSVWTQKEDEIVIKMVSHGNTYSEIAEVLQSKSNLQIRAHYRILRDKMSKGGSASKFEIIDDWNLMQAVALNGRSWKVISYDIFKEKKTASQLQMRWRVLSPLLIVSKDTNSLYNRLKLLHSLGKAKSKALHSSIDERLNSLFVNSINTRKPTDDSRKVCGPYINDSCQELGCHPVLPLSAMMNAESSTYIRPNFSTILQKSKSDNHQQSYSQPSVVFLHSSLKNSSTSAPLSQPDSWTFLNTCSTESTQPTWFSMGSHAEHFMTVFFNLKYLCSQVHDYYMMKARTSVRSWLNNFGNCSNFHLIFRPSLLIG